MLRLTLSSVAALVILGSCSQLTPPSPDEVRTSISETWKQFRSAWLAGDANGATSAFFTEDAMNIVPNLPSSRGRKTITDDFANFFKDNKVTQLEQKIEEVDVAGDLAVERGTFVQTVQPREGAVQIQNGRYLALWKHQQDGSWRCHRFLFNAAPSS